MKKQDVQKETYFRTMFKRQNVVKNFIISLFESSTSFGRLIIEVFIRKNMGRRYFKLSGAIITAFFLFLIPFLPMVFPIFLNSYYAPSFWGTIKEYWIWYLFIAVFLYFSYLRFKDIKHLKAVYDFDHFSLSSGDILPFYWQLKFKGKPFSPRTLEIFIEPLPFFFGGILLMLIGQKLLGALIIFSAIVYCISYARAYANGDEFMLDKIDKRICNEEIARTFTTDEPTGRGFRFYGEKPNSKQTREDIYKDMVDDDFEFTEAD
ncbi:hypothetical protein E6C50_01030 [Flavobacterium supellecticarium]|uniref:Uncharacterized protein n=1 Tax=Flavobacterium supellecticarium TaxID=2565924 RepID=A0A4S4A4E5_9FLAO|nr:hypothetical protein [Flavobacterium supellecticarium]THF52825.1 hypothetical protein E6C50_01030 [Flavobacterium supellecticarium]